MIVTHHATKRTKERLGLGKKGARGMARSALEKGLRHAEATGPLKDYLSRKFRAQGKADNMRIWNDRLFLFRRQTLMTVVLLPASLRAVARKQLARRNAVSVSGAALCLAALHQLQNEWRRERAGKEP